MENSKTLEDCHLQKAEALIQRELAGTKLKAEGRLQLLEAAASKFGGFPLAAYHKAIQVDRVRGFELDVAATRLLGALSKTPIPQPLALAALARPPRVEVEQKRSGSWNTDWRLAQFLASSSRLSGTVLDPACGTGALLVAVASRQGDRDEGRRTKFIAESICGTDRDALAIRGAGLALSSMTSDIGAIRALLGRLRVADALIAPESTWRDQTVRGRVEFDSIIGNPPWERMRITRHEHVTASGLGTHYGDSIPNSAIREAGAIELSRTSMTKYLQDVRPDYDLQGTGDTDLYKLFTELAIRLLKDGGNLSWLLPGGIIRSQGATDLRRWLLEQCSDLRMTVFSNIGRFFSVYRRQKFVLIEARVGKGARRPIQLRHGEGKPDSLQTGPAIALSRSSLLQLREDLAVPEVRTQSGWKLYLHLAGAGSRVRDWAPEFMREVDMSLDRESFETQPSGEAIGVIEGRMVHQYRHDAKRYVSGTGRAARWEATPDDAPCTPLGQFWMPQTRLSDSAAARIVQERVGFCDVTGQTNERGMLCAPIPAGYVCGNKVPTIIFQGHRDPVALGHAFIAIANSLTFDWMLRRMISTSVNYFLLKDLPWPNLDPESLPVRRLADLSKHLSRCSHSTAMPSGSRVGRDKLRLAVELLVAEVWNVPFAGMREIVADFPLLDGGNRPIPGETRSTLTRDLILLNLGEREGVNARELRKLRERVERAEMLGGVAFVPTQFAVSQTTDEHAA